MLEGPLVKGVVVVWLEDVGQLGGEAKNNHFVPCSNEKGRDI